MKPDPQLGAEITRLAIFSDSAQQTASKSADSAHPASGQLAKHPLCASTVLGSRKRGLTRLGPQKGRPGVGVLENRLPFRRLGVQPLLGTPASGSPNSQGTPPPATPHRDRLKSPLCPTGCAPLSQALTLWERPRPHLQQESDEAPSRGWGLYRVDVTPPQTPSSWRSYFPLRVPQNKRLQFT